MLLVGLRRVVLLSLILFSGSALRAQTWHYTNGPFRSDGSKKISDVIAFAKLNDTILFAASDTDGVFRTSDAGDHWQQCWQSSGSKINCIASKGSLVLIGTTEGLVRSSDGGSTFDSVQDISYRPDILELVHDTGSIFYAVAGFSAGGSGSNIECFRSSDGGVTWDTLTSLPGLTTQALLVDSSNNLLFVGGYPSTDGMKIEIQIWKSIDSGSSWSKTEAPYYLEDGAFYGASPTGDLYVSATYEGLIRANDSAYNLWDPIGYPGAGNDIVHHFAFLNDSTVCAAAGEYLYLTNDGGATWESIAGRYQEFPACEFAFNGDLFAAADSGVIRLNTAELSVSEDMSNRSAALSYIYPGKLSLEMNSAGPAQLNLFDITGRSVASFEYAELSGGQTTIALLPSLPNGLYLARCQTRTGFQTCKFIVGP